MATEISMTIAAVARRAGLRTSAIRYYEGVGLLPARPWSGGQRRYGPEVLPRLALIATAKQMGYTIAEIATLMHGFMPSAASARWQVLAAAKLVEVEALIAVAEGMKRMLGEALRCGCLSLDACARILQGVGAAAPNDRC